MDKCIFIAYIFIIFIVTEVLNSPYNEGFTDALHTYVLSFNSERPNDGISMFIQKLTWIK